MRYIKLYTPNQDIYFLGVLVTTYRKSNNHMLN